MVFSYTWKMQFEGNWLRQPASLCFDAAHEQFARSMHWCSWLPTAAVPLIHLSPSLLWMIFECCCPKDVITQWQMCVFSPLWHFLEQSQAKCTDKEETAVVNSAALGVYICTSEYLGRWDSHAFKYCHSPWEWQYLKAWQRSVVTVWLKFVAIFSKCMFMLVGLFFLTTTGGTKVTNVHSYSFT